jgi:hypothetical protein
MPDYSRGKIYKIINDKTEEQYFGSTCEPTLARRLARHIKDYKRWELKKEGAHFVTSFLIFNNNNYHIELVELFSCSSKDELTTREKYYIKNNECVNKYIPMRSKKEYYEDNKEEIAEKRKIYNEANKEIISEKKKIYRNEHKEEIAVKYKIYYEENKEQLAEKHKIYCDEHKEQLAEKAKEKYEANKEQILQKNKEKFNCECGGKYTFGNKYTHCKTKRHQNYCAKVENK